MSADSRSVTTDALATLGTIIDDSAKRDAIHLAVVPMIAGSPLAPGEHVNKNGSWEHPYTERAVGIVDPFLRTNVKPGERFWLVIYPRVITSLRHVWTHPAFADEAPPSVDRSASETWMRAWAEMHLLGMNEDMGYLHTLDEAYDFAIKAGHELRIGSYESARDYIDSTWWDHWETITGCTGERDGYFSCAC